MSNNTREWVITARVNPKKIAELHRAIAKQGVNTNSRSELIGIALDMMHHMLLEGKELSVFPTEEDAHAYLEARGMAPQVGQKGARGWLDRLSGRASLEPGALTRAAQSATPAPPRPPQSAPAPEPPIDDSNLDDLAARLLANLTANGSIVPDEPNGTEK